MGCSVNCFVADCSLVWLLCCLGYVGLLSGLLVVLVVCVAVSCFYC